MDDSDNDRGSLEAAGGRTDDDELNSVGVPSDNDLYEDEDMPGPEGEGMAAGAAPGQHRGSGGGGDDGLHAQEKFLSDNMPLLHGLVHSEPHGPNLQHLQRCLQCANNIYRFMIQQGQPETSDSIFLMYSSFFQPLMREVLPGVVHQLLNEERQVQLCTPHNAEDHRVAFKSFIILVGRYLHLHTVVLQGRELVPAISQRVGEDLSALLRTLAELLEPSALLLTSPAFHSEGPSSVPSWRGVRLGAWASPNPPPPPPPAQQQQQAGGEGSAGGGAVSGDAAGPGGEAASAGDGAARVSTRGVGTGAGTPDADEAVVDLAAADAVPQSPSAHAKAAAWWAAFIDLFGQEGGWDALLQLLSQPQGLGEHLWALLMPLAAAAPRMQPARRAALMQPAMLATQLVRGGLEAAPDLSALEGGSPHSERRVAQVLLVARKIIAAVTSPEQAEAEVGPLAREHVLRLLCAPAFTRQLAGIKQLRDLTWHTFYASRHPASIEALTGWLQQHGVVQQVLKSNLHQAQYAEQAQRVLSMLLQQGCLSEDSIAFLWQLTEDATTFEGVKSNAYSILASLGPHMAPSQWQELFDRLHARAAASGVAEATAICGLLVGMAQQDTQARMWQDVQRCMLLIQVREDAPPEVAGSQAVVEMCATYDAMLGGRDACSMAVAQHCIEQLEGPSAVPAAVVLLSLLTNIWHKPDHIRAFMQQINPGAKLLRTILGAYTAWLDRQRGARLAGAASEAGTTGTAGAAGAAARREGPPAGAFSHREAVDVWMRLLHKVITRGNYFLLQEQVEQLVQWATTGAVCEYDSQQAWGLAARMVADGRKEMMREVAATFLEDCLCTMDAAYLTRAAWRCFLAYLCALSNKWEAELSEDDVGMAGAWVDVANHEAVRTHLYRMVLEAADPIMSHAAAQHLAVINTHQMRALSEGQPELWQQLMAATVSQCLQQLRQQALGVQEQQQERTAGGAAAAGAAGAAMTAAAEQAQAQAQLLNQQWFAPPLVLVAGGAQGSGQQQEAVAEDAQHIVRYLTCQRILRYLTLLAEECQGRRMLYPPAHRSAWQGFELSVLVQLPTQQGQRAVKEELRLPSNLPVGELRRLVADWLGKAPQFVRLLGGGREFENDAATLAASRAGQQLLMAQLSTKHNSYSGHDIAEETAAAAVVRALSGQEEVYRLALALAQPPPAPAPAAAAAAPIVGQASRLVPSALQLLQVLPTCRGAKQLLPQLLQEPEGGRQLKRLLLLPKQAALAAEIGAGHVAAAPRVPPAVLMYTVQSLCGLLFPQQVSIFSCGSCSSDPATVLNEDEGVDTDALQRRLLLSGVLEAVLQMVMQQVGPGSAPGSTAGTAAGTAEAGLDPAVAAATHAAMLLLLHRTYEALDRQQMDAAEAAADAAAAGERGAAPGADVAAGSGPSEPSSMQVDGASAAGEEGGSSGPAAGTGAVPAAAPPNASEERSPSVSMAAASLADAEPGVAASSSGAAGEQQPQPMVGSAAAAAELGPFPAAAEQQELHAAAAALASLAPAVARYVLRMLCAMLGCDPTTSPPADQHLQQGAAGASATSAAATAAGAAAPLAVPADVEGVSRGELCHQALLLLKQLAQQSSSAVHLITAEEAPTTEAVVRSLLLHPTSSHLRQLAAEWLPAFAGAAPPAHRWAFERIVQPLLLAAGADAAGDAGGSSGGGGTGAGTAAGDAASSGSAGGGGSQQEQMALCNHFIDTLEYPEFPAARRLLETLLQRLLEAIRRMQPIDGLASVVGSLIRKLDCRENAGLVTELINHCCFPALHAMRARERAMLLRALAHNAVAAQAAAASANVATAAGAGTAGAVAEPPQQGMQQQGQQQGQQPPTVLLQQQMTVTGVTMPQPAVALAAAAVQMAAADAEAEKVIHAARAQGAGAASSGAASREAAFELLLDLVLHDSGCWRQAQEQLQTNVHVAPGQVFPQQFGNVPLQNLRAPGAFAGLQNGGATCYMSSVFQQLFMQPTIRRLILGAPGIAPEEQADSVFHQMQAMFAHLALGVEPWFEPRGFWRSFKDYDGQPVNIREHQDAYEFFTRLQDAVDEHLRAQGCPRAIHAALGGTFAQLITVVEAPQYRSERDEEFYQISLDVRGKRTLAESLRSFVCKELMDGQNQYHCEELGKKVDAEKRTLIKQLPHTLVLHLKRFEWDYETYQRWKVKDRFEFPMQLDMYPYTVEGADEADGRDSSGRKPAAQYQYELRGVVVHSGSAFAGHYYSYIKDREPGRGGWYCFDDTSVDPWDPAKLDKDCFGGRFIPEGFTQECDRPNSAYMLFYERAEPEPGAELAAVKGAAAGQQAATAAAAPAAGADAEEGEDAEGTDVVMRSVEPLEGASAGAAAAGVPPAAAAAGAVGAGAVGAEPAGDAAGQSPGRGGGTQPMALSPAPPDQQQEVGPEAPAAGGGGEQPPAAATQQQQQQEEGVGAAGAAGPLAVAVAAAAEQGSAVPYGMPRGLYETILHNNLRQLTAMQLLSLEYCRFIWQLCMSLREAVTAGTARKAAKREPTSSPGAMDLSAASGSASGGGGGSGGGDCQLQALTSRRGGDLHAVVADVAVLCLDYFLQVALRGGLELRKEVVGSGGRRGHTPGLQDPLYEALSKVPAAAAAALVHMSSGMPGVAANVLLTQHSSQLVRSFVMDCFRQAADCLARQERQTEEALHAICAAADHLCGSTVPFAMQVAQRGDWHADELLLALQRLASPKHPWRRALVDPHLPTLLDFIRLVAQQSDDDRVSQPAGQSALTLLSFMLRRFSTDTAAGERSRRKPTPLHGHLPQRNPHCLEGVEPTPMPAEVQEWLWGDPSFPRKLLMPGCLHSTPVVRLLLFLMHNNHRDFGLWMRALLEHVLLDATDWRDLAMETDVLNGLLTGLKDALYEERIAIFLVGMDNGPNGILREMMNARRGTGCQHLLLAIALSLLSEAPNELVVDVLSQEARWTKWAEKFLHKRYARQQECEEDESRAPDSPSADNLAAEGEVAYDLVDLQKMWSRLLYVVRIYAGGAASPATADSGSSGSAGGGGQGGPPGSAGGAGGSGSAAAPQPQEQHWQEELMEYGGEDQADMDTAGADVAGADVAPPPGGQGAGGSGGGAIAGTQQGAAAAAPLPAGQAAAPLGARRRSGGDGGGGGVGLARGVRSEKGEAELLLQPQQHISAGIGFGPDDGEDQEAEVIEIHSSDQDQE